MQGEKLLIIIAIVAVAVSVIAAGVTFFSVANLVNKISGLATITGEANLTVETTISVNFTDNIIDWGSGIVNIGQSSAFLDTTTGTVVNGNWTADSTGLRLENIGNVNVSLNISGTKTAATFLGGTSPSYQWNISLVEANSCLNSSGGSDAMPEKLAVFGVVNTTVTAQFCPIFQFKDTADLLRIDFNLTVPSDSEVGALTDTITATAIAL